MKGYSSKNYVGKFLRALYPKLESKGHNIERANDIIITIFDELIGNLKVHEMIIKKDSEIVKAKVERKSLALKVKKEYSHSVVMMSLLGSIKSEHWVVNRLYWNEVSPSPFLLDPVIKQLAIKLVGENGFVIRPVHGLDEPPDHVRNQACDQDHTEWIQKYSTYEDGNPSRAQHQQALEVQEKEMEAPTEELKQNSYNSVRNSSLNDSYCSQRFKAGGSIIDLMDELVKVRQTMGYNMDGWLGHKTKKGWIKELCTKNRFNFVSLQETKMERMELVTTNKLWGNTSYDYAFSSSLGGYWWDGECVIMGDFNEVRSEQEMYGSVFNVHSASAFNNFISLASLIDLPLDGYAYTWVHKSATKMSKLDRFLISKGLMASFPHISAIYLDKHLSDHRPILMREMNIDYGPTPFRFFHSWFKLEDFDKLVKDTWMHLDIADSNGMIQLKKKLQALKIIIKEWTKNAKKCSYKKKSSIQSKLSDIDKIIDQGWNKSPGPGGFTFEFFRRYWKLLENDISVAVMKFFSSGAFPKGCNSSFIALIPKTQNVKTVKDFCPISLIGSLYKIIAKILANRLSSVIPYLISDVQSTFVSNRQILDGPFILNELLSWCKYKKLKAMVFKVDFEKAFDSIRWDYLDDVLKTFGFGDKWRGWINSCLKSAKGYVLVNRRLFTGIHLDNSLTISHLFYADDAIFVGKWDTSNLKILLKFLKCFHMASRLKININKSKLMGYDVHSDEVEIAARYIGYANLVAPFSHFGVKVGGRMERINSWDDVVSKVTYRLSKWKLKTLSIGGRLTLIKSVLSSIPLYQMSSFKVPIKVLNILESIRRKFFNGIEGNERKMALISWETVLALKKYGGLGVSNALRGLISFERSMFFVLKPRGGIEEEQQNMLFSRLSGVILPNMRDHWVWSLEASGEFSITSARRLINNYLLPKGDVQTRWVKVVPIKINVFAWRVRLEKLPTRLNLSFRGVEISSIMCPL
ncbi:RNA-directed DNA polymerase, eukaryota [Tanacetum coccineum]